MTTFPISFERINPSVFYSYTSDASVLQTLADSFLSTIYYFPKFSRAVEQIVAAYEMGGRIRVVLLEKSDSEDAAIYGGGEILRYTYQYVIEIEDQTRAVEWMLKYGGVTCEI